MDSPLPDPAALDSARLLERDCLAVDAGLDIQSTGLAAARNGVDGQAGRPVRTLSKCLLAWAVRTGAGVHCVGEYMAHAAPGYRDHTGRTQWRTARYRRTGTD